jgi:alpha-glucosidase
VALAAALFGAGRPRTEALGAVTDVQTKDGYVELSCKNGVMRISSRGDGVLHVRATHQSAFSDLPSFALKPGVAADAAPAMSDSDDKVVLTTPLIRAEVDKHTGNVNFFDGAGHDLAAEPADGGVFFAGEEVSCVKTMPPDEHYYGFGEKTGPLSKRGTRMVMWNSANIYTTKTDPMYQSHPFFLAVRGGRSYGLFFDNTYKSVFDMGKSDPGRYSFAAAGGEMNYYVLAGPGPREVLTRYGSLVGTMNLPPLWGLGYHQCRYSYKTATRVREIRDGFLKNNIPVDAIYLDIHYMDGYRDFTFDPQRFPDPKGLVDELKQGGIHTVVIVDPGVKVDPGYYVYEQGIAGNYFVPGQDGKPFSAWVWPKEANFPDFYRADVRKWWGGLHKFYTDLGIDGIWNDMNELAGWKHDIRIADVPVPLGKPDWEEMRHGVPPDVLPHAVVRNAYASLEAQATYEGLISQRPDERPLIISRAGYPGLQRYSLIWTGDNTASWDQLAMGETMLLNLGLTGLSWVGNDVGGFVGAPSNELYVRWLEQGIFYPFCRNHTAIKMPDKEPWSFTPEITDISRDLINFRYRLLPYTYTVFEESSRLNWPVMRAMVFEFPADPAVADMSDQFMLGQWLLAAPVIEKGRIKRRVHFPAGNWYDFFSGEKISGPADVEVDAPPGKFPLFAKEGAIIPLAPLMRHTGEKPWDPLTVVVFPGSAPSSFTLYEDDGKSFAYENGQWARTTFHCAPVAGGVEITIEPRSGAFDPQRQTIELQVRGQKPEDMVSLFASDGKALSAPAATFDRASSLWLVKLPGDGAGFTVRIAEK